MKKPIDVGNNRTGIAITPDNAKKTADGAVDGVPEASVDIAPLTEVRLEYSREAEPVGTLPPLAKKRKAAGKVPNVFLDLLGERLAFERSGVRLYELMLVKLDAGSPHKGGPEREDLEEHRDQELKHFAILVRALEQLGADPTAVTPSADQAVVASHGLHQVLADPRTTLSEGLQALRTAELADNDGWQLLVDLAEQLGHDDLAEEFREALEEEQEHLEDVRSWIQATVLGQAGIARTPRAPSPEAPEPT